MRESFFLKRYASYWNEKKNDRMSLFCNPYEIMDLDYDHQEQQTLQEQRWLYIISFLIEEINTTYEITLPKKFKLNLIKALELITSL